jgi:hypothetical protein
VTKRLDLLDYILLAVALTYKNPRKTIWKSVEVVKKVRKKLNLLRSRLQQLLVHPVHLEEAKLKEEKYSLTLHSSLFSSLLFSSHSFTRLFFSLLM